jgi:hypothetical protein
MHWLPQVSIGALQVEVHCPLLQNGVLHAGRVQPPQWAGSLFTSMQAVPHSTWGLTHSHWPPLQTWPMPQLLPQVPQWAGVDCRSTQVVPHRSSPEPQPPGGVSVVPLAQPATIRSAPNRDKPSADKRGLRPFMVELLND